MLFRGAQRRIFSRMNQRPSKRHLPRLAAPSHSKRLARGYPGRGAGVSPLLAFLFLFGTIAIVGIVALVTGDRYDLRIRSGEHELQLRPAAATSAPQSAVTPQLH